MKLLPIYVLDDFVDLQGYNVIPQIPVQILVHFPDYARLVAFGTDYFNTKRIFDDIELNGRKSFGVSAIDYRIIVIDVDSGDNVAIQKYHHPFETSSPVVFQDGMMRFKDDVEILRMYDELDGMPNLTPKYLYGQFVN